MYRFLLIILVFLPLWTSAWAASRIINLPPVRNVSVHSGAGGCVTGDYWFPTGTPAPSGSVSLTLHGIQFSFQNIGSVQQDVKVILLKGSHAQMANSRQSPQNWSPSEENGNFVTSSNYEIETTIEPNETAVSSFTLVCAHTGCELRAGGTTLQNTLPNPLSSFDCLKIRSTLSFRVEVSQAQGALTGFVSTEIHRGGGTKDDPKIVPANFAILGGRPF